MKEHIFDTRPEASRAAANRIVELLADRLDHNKRASLVVSGGTSPQQCLSLLANAPLDWQRVQVALSDERWVPPDHQDSNEKMVRETLLVDRAASAQLLSVYSGHVTPAERCDELQDPLPELPFACSLIGIGVDGHFASLFPDADTLETGLDVDSGRLYVPVATAASPHPRMSMTLAGISRSDEIALLFFGDDKRAVFEQAKASADAHPLSRLLRQKRALVSVFWAP